MIDRKGAPDGSTSLDLSSGGRPNVRGQFQPSLVVPSLKLGFGTCVPRPAAPVRGHGGDASNGIDGRGAGLESVVPVYRSREERGDNGCSLSPPAIAISLNPVTLALYCRPHRARIAPWSSSVQEALGDLCLARAR